MKKEKPIHIGRAIKEELDRQGRKTEWFAGKLCCERTNVYDIFKRESMNTDMLMQISVVLGVDFFALYSSKIRGKVEPLQ